MSVIAILPVKRFDRGKQRLSEGLSAGPRRALAEAMFSDVLTALRRATTPDRTVVVTADATARQIATGHGTEVLEDAGAGHSEAAALGIDWAMAHGARSVLLIPGDCPLIAPEEIDALFRHSATAERSALIVPDRHGTGTNALLLSPPDVIAPAFGQDSRARHARLAGAAGARAELVEVPGLALDVDTPDDLQELEHRLAETRGGAAHTRGMLNQMARSLT